MGERMLSPKARAKLIRTLIISVLDQDELFSGDADAEMVVDPVEWRKWVKICLRLAKKTPAFEKE